MKELDLQEIRGRIDALDARLVELMCERMQLSAEVAEYKQQKGMAVLDRAREEAILDARAAQAGEALGPYIRGVYERVFEMSRGYQTALLERAEK